MMNEKLLQEMIEQRYVNVQKHPGADLFIYNYSQSTQFDGMWNEVTLMCRGLIRDGKGNIVARPFPKFFNLSQVPDLPAENFVATEKMDGSLGILYQVDGVPYVATRGSFTSEQAIKATQILRREYGYVTFNTEYTYLFEIIFPANRIVVDYGDMEDLVLLAIIETKTGKELSYEQVYEFATENTIPVVKRYDGLADLEAIKKLEQRPNAEGLVLTWPDGTRAKSKFEEYVRLHRLVTGVNAKTIWELLKNGDSYEELLDRVPDEFYEWVKATVRELQEKYDETEKKAQEAFEQITSTTPYGKNVNRKYFAEHAKLRPHPQLLFAMLDGKDYSNAIWKMLRPVAEKPFKMEIE
jgi:RNA ligase